MNLQSVRFYSRLTEINLSKVIGVQIGDTVMFNEEEYSVIWIYNNGNCEIRKKGPNRKVELVALSKLDVVNITKKKQPI